MTKSNNYLKNNTGTELEETTISQNVYFLRYVDKVAETLQQASRPMSRGDLAAVLATKFELAEETALLTVQQVITEIYQAIELESGRYGWLTNLITGSTVRHPLTSEEASSGFLLLDELEHSLFFPEFFQLHQPTDRVLHIQLFGGPIIPAESYIENKTWALRLGDQFSEWVDKQGGQGRDDIIIMVDNAASGEYTLRLQPREFRDDNLIQSRNVQMSLVAENIVRRSCLPNVAMHTWDLAALILAANIFDDTVPPDDMHCVLHQYSMLRFNGKVGYLFNPDDEKNSLHNKEHDTTILRSYPPFGFGDSSKTSDELRSQAKFLTDIDTALGTSGQEGTDANSDSDYDYYVEKLYQIGLVDAPLSQKDFLLLKAELKALVCIEHDHGQLLDEQCNRRDELISYLLIRSETLLDDSDIPDQQDYDDPACWDE